MEMIEVTLPDGSIVAYPADTPEEEILAAIEAQFGAQAEQPQRVEEPIGLGGEAALGATQAAFDVMSADSGRGQKMGDIFEATLKGDQSISEGVTQAYGQGFASLGDLIGKGVGLVGKGMSAITPDALEDEVMTQLGIFFDQPLMQMGKRALQAGGEAWDQFSQENPRAARNIEAGVNILGVGIPTNIGRKSVVKAAREFESPAAVRARQDIAGGPTTATRETTAPYRLEQAKGAEPTVVSDVGPLQEPIVPMRAVKSPVQQEAIKQGFDSGLVAMIREASPADRRDMMRSLAIMKEATANRRYSMLNRPSDIAGRNILNRFNFLKDKNKQAGRGIDEFARKNMTKDYVDFTGAVDNFQNNLENMGIRINDDLSLDFSGSTIKGLSGIENFLSRVVDRMADPRDLNSYEIHNFKRFIDEQVNYGKQLEGLSGNAESIVAAPH